RHRGPPRLPGNRRHGPHRYSVPAPGVGEAHRPLAPSSSAHHRRRSGPARRPWQRGEGCRDLAALGQGARLRMVRSGLEDLYRTGRLMRYFKFRWRQSPGDDHDHPEWGDSWWYYEFGPDGSVRRQIMLYDNGIRLRYGPGHIADGLGELL